MQPLHCDAVQGGVVQHHHCVRMLREPLEGEHAVVRLHNHVAALALVGEDAVGLDQLLAVPDRGGQEADWVSRGATQQLLTDPSSPNPSSPLTCH